MWLHHNNLNFFIYFSFLTNYLVTSKQLSSWNCNFPYTTVTTHIILMNQIVHLNIVNRIVRPWTVTPLKSLSLFFGFSKTGVHQKSYKRAYGLIHNFPFVKFFINPQKIIQPIPYYSLKDSLQISIKSVFFILIQESFEKFE